MQNCSPCKRKGTFEPIDGVTLSHPVNLLSIFNELEIQPIIRISSLLIHKHHPFLLRHLIDAEQIVIDAVF
jgi:hypothetical protein